MVRVFSIAVIPHQNGESWVEAVERLTKDKGPAWTDAVHHFERTNEGVFGTTIHVTGADSISDERLTLIVGDALQNGLERLNRKLNKASLVNVIIEQGECHEQTPEKEEQ
ncbi:hypothetical protein D3C74_49410 [compost metagenome]